MRQLITQSVVADAARRRRRHPRSPSLTVPLFSTPRASDAAGRHSTRPGSARARRRGAVHDAHRAGVRPVSGASRRARTGFAALREGSRAGGGRKQRVRAVLVTVEVTMSVILLITSGLLIRAVWRVQAIDPGFAPRERADAQDRAAAAEVRQPGAPRRVLRSRAGRRARAAGRPERGVHQRPADGRDRPHHRRRDPRSGRARAPAATA